MARRLRLPLLLLLGALTTLFVLLPASPALAEPTCAGRPPGHYYDCDDINGYQDSSCGPIVYCKIGQICYTWDCVPAGGGGTTVANVSAQTTFCNCFGYTLKKCC
jgi:hypothetical protein